LSTLKLVILVYILVLWKWKSAREWWPTNECFIWLDELK